MMKFLVLTIFPELFQPFRQYGIVGRAVKQGKIGLSTVNIRDFAKDKHRTTDDRPYGGGCGMVMKPEPLAAAIREAKKRAPAAKTILLTPQGRKFSQQMAGNFAACEGITLVCGRYEGVDERVVAGFIDEEISIGDFILTGGELAAMMIIEAVARLIPGILGGEDSADKDTFSEELVEHAQYTRPSTFEGEAVPAVLRSGNHKEIERWRVETSMIRTFLKRPDLLENRRFKQQEIDVLKKWRRDIDGIIKAQSVSGTAALPGSG
jgi:tRNA (guanine37-N1)-methyltransferase